MYFIVRGSHPALGYPDQPPVVPMCLLGHERVRAGSLLVLRLPSALAARATTSLAACVSRELGSEQRAREIAAVCTANNPLAAPHPLQLTVIRRPTAFGRRTA